MSLLSQGAGWLREQRRTQADAVTYRRGSDEIADLPATKGRTTQQAESGEFVIAAGMVDWIIDVADLVMTIPGHAIQRLGPTGHGIKTMGPEGSTGPIKPRAGDQVVAGGIVYAVAATDGGDVWRWHGRNRLTMRVHTVEVGS